MLLCPREYADEDLLCEELIRLELPTVMFVFSPEETPIATLDRSQISAFGLKFLFFVFRLEMPTAMFVSLEEAADCDG